MTSIRSDATVQNDPATFYTSTITVNIGTMTFGHIAYNATSGAFPSVVSGMGFPGFTLGDLGDIEEIIIVPEPVDVPDFPPAETPIVTEPEKVPVPA